MKDSDDSDIDEEDEEDSASKAAPVEDSSKNEPEDRPTGTAKSQRVVNSLSFSRTVESQQQKSSKRGGCQRQREILG